LGEKNTAEKWLEVSKVWYSLFCTLMDGFAEGEFSREQVLDKLLVLRRELAERVPAVEAMMAKKRN
jgi:hypothetical protein